MWTIRVAMKRRICKFVFAFDLADDTESVKSVDDQSSDEEENM